MKEEMKAGIVAFSFIKGDGAIRQAKGTLNSELFQYEAKTDGAKSAPDVIRYFDTEANGWRSFRIERLISNAA